MTAAAARSLLVALAALSTACGALLGIEDRRVGTDETPATEDDSGIAASRDAGEGETAPGAGTFCAGKKHDACFDFEDGAPLPASAHLEFGVLSIDPSGSSSSRSLRAVANENQEAQAWFQVPIAGSPTHLHYTVDISFEKAPDVETTVLVFSYGTGKSCSLQPAADQGEVRLYQYCRGFSATDSNASHTIMPLEGAGWYTYELDADFGTRRVIANVRAPSGKVGTLNVALDQRLTQSSDVHMRIGMTFASPARPGVDLRVDNVALDYEP